MTSQALLRLNLETRTYHAAADAGWLAFLGPIPGKWDYIRRLITTYGFEAPLEAAVVYTPNLRPLIDVRARCRAGLIAEDLLALGLSAAEISAVPQCFPIAPFGDPVEALGWLYVSERSTLLHDSIRSHIVARVPDAARASAYLSAAEGTASMRWHDLGSVLDRVTADHGKLAELVQAAHSGFRCLLQWNDGAAARVARGA